MGEGCSVGLPIMYMAQKPVLWVCYVISMLLVLIGLFGNILSFRILGYDKSRRNQSSTFYLKALSVADCISLIFNTLFSSQQMMLRPALMLYSLNPVVLMVNSFPACNIRMFLSSTATMVSVYIIVMFSIERALVLSDPFRWSRLLTLRKAKAGVAALVLVSCLVSLPSVFSFRRELTYHPRRLYNLTTGTTYRDRELLDASGCFPNASGGVVGGRYSALLNQTEDRPKTGLLSEYSIFRPRSNATIQRALRKNKRLRQAAVASGRTAGILPLQTRAPISAPTRKPQSSQSKSQPVPPPQYHDADEVHAPPVPPGIALECQEVAECRMNFRVFKPFAAFHMITLSVVPFILTGVCNLLILTVLRRREFRELHKAANPKRKGEDTVDKQVTKRLVLVSTTYISLSFPLALFHIVTDAMTGTYCFTWAANTLTITITLNSVNFAINFILYCISEDQFRRLLATLLHCRRRDMSRLLSYVTRPGQGPEGRRNGPAGGNRPGAAGAARGSAPPGGNNNVNNNTTTTSVDGRQPPTTDAQVHNFADCSLGPDDWSSGQFSEGGGVGGSGGGGGSERRKSGIAAIAKWSEVLPESTTE